MMLKVGTIKSLPPANHGPHDALCDIKRKYNFVVKLLDQSFEVHM